jgi:hypothetical protein
MRPAADGGPRRVPAGVDPAMSRSATVVRLSADLPRTVRRAAWGIACRLSWAAPDPGQAACPGEPRSNRRAPARPKPNGTRHEPSARPPRWPRQRPRARRRGCGKRWPRRHGARSLTCACACGSPWRNTRKEFFTSEGLLGGTCRGTGTSLLPCPRPGPHGGTTGGGRGTAASQRVARRLGLRDRGTARPSRAHGPGGVAPGTRDRPP